MTKIKALSLFSGGLDSMLATKLILNQGIKVEGIHFSNLFCQCKEENTSGAVETAKQLGIPIKVEHLGNEYLRIVKKPKHGYGKNMNPCVDCKIFMIKKAKKYSKEVGAAFIFTGEVLGERPMSQHYQALKTIEEEAGVKGKLLRPLSANLLPETIAEKKGLVNRNKLFSISGRSRKPQIKLATELGIKNYPSPAGGCLLTCKEFANRLRDLFHHKKRCSMADVGLLKIGRHFRFGNNKIIVGRNETENKVLALEKARNDYWFEVPDVGSPTTILQGPKTRIAIEKAAELTAFYSDTESNCVTVNFGRECLEKSVTVSIPNKAEVKSYMIR